jgi:peptidoglycan/xylan/chitin deacetylase (PgdA/CDA1 family)
LIHRQDLSLLLFYYLGYSRIRNLFLRLRRKPVVRFVTFHDLPPEASGRFRANLDFLKRRTNVVSLDDYFSGKLSSERINVAITFDDGYKGWVTNAMPVLRELKLPATFFISSGFVGLSKEDEAEFIRSKLFGKLLPRRLTGSLSLDDVRRIAGEGFGVGGHTVSHCNLAELCDYSQLKCEIAEDRGRLERITGRKVEYFAYPSGLYQNPEIELAEVLRASGYKGAVTTVPGFNSIGSNPYLLHRDLTRATMPGPIFRAIVYGNYDAPRFLKQRARIVLQWR